MEMIGMIPPSFQDGDGGTRLLTSRSCGGIDFRILRWGEATDEPTRGDVVNSPNAPCPAPETEAKPKRSLVTPRALVSLLAPFRGHSFAAL
jgi:hypothetical protein